MKSVQNRQFATAALLICAILAAIVSPLYVVGWDLDAFRVTANDELKAKIQLWLFLISSQAAVWVLCLFYLAAALKKFAASISFRKHVLDATIPFAIPALVLTTLIWLGGNATPPIPPPKLGDYDIHVLQGFGQLGVAVAALAIWVMYVVRSWLLAQMESAASESEKVKHLIRSREETFRLIFIAAIILGLGTLAGAALRNAGNADKANGPNFFPEEYVILFGAIYSLALVIVYAPVQSSLIQAGTTLRDSLLKDPPVSGEAVKTWYETRQKLEEALGLSLNEASTFGTPLVTLLPLLSGWLGNLLGKK